MLSLHCCQPQRELPGFGLTGGMAEKRKGSFHYLSILSTNKGATLGVSTGSAFLRRSKGVEKGLKNYATFLLDR